MEIRRDIYLDKLISKKHNRLIKVITGIRRCGKSYLLFNLFRDHLESEGVSDDHIIEMAFDLYENIEYRDPKVFFPYVKIAIGRVPGPLDHRLRHRGACREIHVGHPHGNDIEALLRVRRRKGRVALSQAFYRDRVLPHSVHYRFKIVFHFAAVFSCSTYYSLNIPVPPNPLLW